MNTYRKPPYFLSISLLSVGVALILLGVGLFLSQSGQARELADTNQAMQDPNVFLPIVFMHGEPEPGVNQERQIVLATQTAIAVTTSAHSITATPTATAAATATAVASNTCLLYTSPSPRDLSTSRMPSSA